MKEQDKTHYEAPSAMVFEVRAEGAICNTSPGEASVQNYTWHDEVEE